MSIRLEAPYGATAQITFLPNPDVSDEEGMDIETIVKKAMDNTTYSYNRRPDNTARRIALSFSNIARNKIVEVIEFFELYGGGFIRLIDHRDRHWKVMLENNPIDFTINKRASPVGGNESGSFELIFFGRRV